MRHIFNSSREICNRPEFLQICLKIIFDCHSKYVSKFDFKVRFNFVFV